MEQDEELGGVGEEAAENNEANPYVLLVPLSDEFHCRICLPVPRIYAEHNGLAKHVRREHKRAMAFSCRGCGMEMAKLRAMKLHQKEGACSGLEAAPEVPTNLQRGIRPRMRRQMAVANGGEIGQRQAGSSAMAGREIQAARRGTRAAPQQRQITRGSDSTEGENASEERRADAQRQANVMVTQLAGEEARVEAMEQGGPRQRQVRTRRAAREQQAEPSTMAEQEQQEGPSMMAERVRPEVSRGARAAPRQRASEESSTSEGECPVRMRRGEAQQLTNAEESRSETEQGVVEAAARLAELRMSPTGDWGAWPPVGTQQRQQPHRNTTAFNTPPPTLATRMQGGARVQRPEAHTRGTSWQREWCQRFNGTTTADELEQQLELLMEEVGGSHPEMGAQTARPTGRWQQRHQGQQRGALQQQRRYDPAAASRIQKLYRSCRPKAFRQVISANSPFCTIPAEDLHHYFSRVFSHKGQTEDLERMEMPEAVPDHEAQPDTRNPFSEPFTPEELFNRLRRCSNTAPGPDGIRYGVWRKADPGCHVLCSVYNAVARIQHVPESWNTSSTILLHKKGSKDEVGNWRPISLSNTVAKLYASVLAERLGKWAARNNRVSHCQKGFMPVDGCSEHNYVLQSALLDARRRRKECTVAWLDLTNAFGSIPHATIFKSLEWAGLDATAIDTIRRLYANCYTTVRASGGPTPRIAIRAGVKQGCPLSPIVFNLALEPALRAAQRIQAGYELGGGEQTVDVLAYADDLALIAPTSEQLQQLLDTVGKVADWAGLAFNPRKCATLHVDGRQKAALHTTFEIQGGRPPALEEPDFYEHLGVPTGFHTATTAEQVVKEMSEQVRQVDASLLAPWQKFDAVNTFILPSISFHLKNAVVEKKPLTKLDKQIKEAGKRWLNLPQRASTEMLYIGYQQGGLNLLPINVLSDISQVVHGLRLLHSTDIQQLAREQLREVVQRRMRRPPTQQEVAEYLNGSMEGDFANESTDLSSAWTRLRVSTRRLRSKLNVEWSPTLELRLDGSPTRPTTVETALRSALRSYFLRKLLTKRDQGKVYAVTSKNMAANHFMRGGDFLRFADWRFLHRARLDCVPLNGARRFGHGDRRCRRCGYANETLPHVLCHCHPNMEAITRRHDAVLNRIGRAHKPRPSATVRRNQRIPGSESALRPDYVVMDDQRKEVIIIDVTVPFENGSGAFEAARAEKCSKYAGLVDHLRQRDYEVYCDAFVVGALGGWDPANEVVLQALGIGAHYARLMRKLMVADVVKWSRDIYVGHVTGKKQYET